MVVTVATTLLGGSGLYCLSEGSSESLPLSILATCFMSACCAGTATGLLGTTVGLPRTCCLLRLRSWLAWMAVMAVLAASFFYCSCSSFFYFCSAMSLRIAS